MSDLLCTDPKPRPIDLLFGEMALRIDRPNTAPVDEGGRGRAIVDGAGPEVIDHVEPSTVPEVEPGPNETFHQAGTRRFSGEYMSLASAIDSLFRQMPEPATDSPKLREYCLSLLSEARQVLESEEFAEAGYDTQQAEARLLRARLTERPADLRAFLAVARRAPAAMLHTASRALSTTEKTGQATW
jgi:hypothetical protein